MMNSRIFIRGVGLVIVCLSMTRALAAEMTQVQDRSPLRFADPAMAGAQVRKLVLANGMRVYLLHDATARTSSVACGVAAGSWQDPPQAAGMAHFVEHLLFMGTADYPDENDFMAWVARHGGSTNAYTTVDRTVYMFDVEPSGLRGGMLRLGAFFRSPLFADAAIARERVAVDQEFRAKQHVDGWREFMVDAALSDAAHPNSYFSPGTADSLGRVDHGQMQQWFTQHYSSHVMDVVVRGSQSLDILQAATIEAFADVPRRAVEYGQTSGPLMNSAYAASTVMVEPMHASTRELSVKWDLPAGLDDHGDETGDLLAYLLDSQGKNSLLAHLRDAGLADDIGVLARRFADGRMLLTVSFDVTDRGAANHGEVLALLFATLRELGDLQRLTPLVHEWRTQRWRAYAYETPGPSYDAVAKIADRMLTCDLDTFPQPEGNAANVTQKTWTTFLSRLTPAASRAMLVARGASSAAKPDAQRLETTTGVPFAVVLQSVPNEPRAQAPGFGVPAVNPWMPRDIDVMADDMNAPSLTAPLHFADDAHGSIFIARHPKQASVELGLLLDIKTPAAVATDARAEALYDLWWQAAETRLTDLRSEAEAAGLRLAVEPSEGGIRVSLSGFAERAPKLLGVVLRRLNRLGTDMTVERFDALRTRLERSYDDQAGARPRDTAYERLFVWRMQRVWSTPEKKAALTALSPDEFTRAANKIFAETYTQASFFGNIDLKTAYACRAAIDRYLRREPYEAGRHPARAPGDMVALEEPARLFVQARQGQGNAVVMQLCEASDTPENKAAAAVLGHMLEPIYFDDLRTRQQTAYNLSTSGISRDGQLFRTFAISPFHVSANEAAGRIDTFLRTTAARLGAGSLSREEFAAYKAAVRSQWTADVNGSAPGALRLQWLAFERRGNFLLVQRRIEALDRLDYETFLIFARRALTTRHRVEVLVESSGAHSHE